MPKTKIIKIDPVSPDERALKLAGDIIKDGGLVAFPTETVYGIGANLLDPEAVKRLRQIKKRPASKPFTVHIASIDMISGFGCEISALTRRLISEFWPGPLTIVLKMGDNTCGFRMPRNKIAKAIISESGVPVIMPSANLSGENPPSKAADIPEELYGEIDMIIDGGSTDIGTESTVIDLSREPYRVLRQGAISGEDIAHIAGDQ